MELQIRRIRQKKNIKQVVIAHLAGIDPKTLSAIELGKQSPRTETLQRIAEALECDVTDFFTVPTPSDAE